MVKFLIEHEADPYQLNPQGNNCVHTAAQGDQPAIIYYLVRRYGLQIDESNRNGSTALHWAANDDGNYHALSYILALRADINRGDQRGLTALHLAVQASQEDQNSRCVRLLLRRGADKLARDVQNRTPRDIAS